MFCGSQSLVKPSEGRIHVKPARCRSWPCETCGPIRRSRLEIEIEAGNPDALLTLTSRRILGASPDVARRKLGKDIKEFLRRVRRDRGVPIEYYVAIEKHKSGWPHAHLAVRGWLYIAHPRLKALWRAVTGDSDHIHIRRVPPKKVKRYLAKYIGKDLHRFGTAKRYWHSKGWLPKGWDAPSEGDCEQFQGWQHITKHPLDVIAGYQLEGYHTHHLGWAEAVMLPAAWMQAGARAPPSIQEGRP